jgi:YggT family protein
MSIAGVILKLLFLFKVALFIRIIIDYIRIFAPSWRPNAILIAFFELIYTVTEPVMAFVRRYIPPLRLGGVALDISFIILIFVIQMAEGVISTIG